MTDNKVAYTECYAQIILDIPTRKLDSCFDYKLPAHIRAQFRSDEEALGRLVLVPFASRMAVGYIVSLSETPRFSEKTIHYKEVAACLSEPLFKQKSLELALWISERYLCPLSEGIKLICPPGKRPQVYKDTEGNWQLDLRRTQKKKRRFLCITPTIEPQEILNSLRKDAQRQKMVIEALAQGPMMYAELALGIPGVAAAVKALKQKGFVCDFGVRELRGNFSTQLKSAHAPRRELYELTQDQRNAFELIERARLQSTPGSPQVVLVDGVTGSGKTEVYLQVIASCLHEGKTAIVLVPEISLTPQTVGRFRSRFGDRIAVLHSRMSEGERFDQWDLAYSGVVPVVVGARSALFAPLDNIGLIIIDEEHETSYKQGASPRYHARDLALQLASLHGACLVLGSATPSLEASYAADHRASWQRASMRERANGRALPPVTLIDMGEEFAAGHRSMFSRRLIQDLRSCVERREKALIFLNRRGFAHFYLCRECGYVPRCEHCSISLTYHRKNNKMLCHSCGASYEVPARCPRCNSPYLRSFGAGTQRVEDELRALFGETLPIIRMDADTTGGKGSHELLLEKFDASESAILLGTQMIAKGLDFPELSLACVLNADTSLEFPDFRAAEKAFSLLEQVGGRVGRGSLTAQVLIQTYCPNHPVLQALRTHDKDSFVAGELEERRLANYPPYTRLVRVVVSAAQEADARRVSRELAEFTQVILVSCFNPEQISWSLKSEADRSSSLCLPLLTQQLLIGPSPCLISKQQDRYRWHFLIRLPLDCEPYETLRPLADKILSFKGRITVAIDVDPYDLM